MMFLVSIYQGSRLVWIATVEAEDDYGAQREALNLMEDGGGNIIRAGRGKPSGPITIDVEPRERIP